MVPLVGMGPLRVTDWPACSSMARSKVPIEERHGPPAPTTVAKVGRTCWGTSIEVLGGVVELEGERVGSTGSHPEGVEEAIG